MRYRCLHDPKYALTYGLLALLLFLPGGLLFREAGELRERAEGIAAENQLLLSYRHAERDAARADLLSSLFQKAPASDYGELLEAAGVSVKEISEEKDGKFHKIHVVGTGSFSQIVRGFDIIKSKEVWNAVKLVRLKREGTVLSFTIEITAFQSRGTYEEEKYRTDRSDGDR